MHVIIIAEIKASIESYHHGHLACMVLDVLEGVKKMP